MPDSDNIPVLRGSKNNPTRGYDFVSPHFVTDSTGFIEDFQTPGLTKREHFAALAMQALLSNPAMVDVVSDAVKDRLAEDAVKMADALVQALQVPAPEPEVEP